MKRLVLQYWYANFSAILGITVDKGDVYFVNGDTNILSSDIILSDFKGSINNVIGSINNVKGEVTAYIIIVIKEECEEMP